MLEIYDIRYIGLAVFGECVGWNWGNPFFIPIRLMCLVHKTEGAAVPVLSLFTSLPASASCFYPSTLVPIKGLVCKTYGDLLAEYGRHSWVQYVSVQSPENIFVTLQSALYIYGGNRYSSMDSCHSAQACFHSSSEWTNQTLAGTFYVSPKFLSYRRFSCMHLRGVMK